MSRCAHIGLRDFPSTLMTRRDIVKLETYEDGFNPGLAVRPVEDLVA